jgi:DNA-binding transcriptional regulator YbjK
MTYHFRDLDALLGAALEWISGEEIRILENWQQRWDLETQLEDALVDLVLLYTNERRLESMLEYEVHILAYRSPSMKDLNTRWERAFTDILAPHLSTTGCELVIAMFDGIMLYGLGRDGPLEEAWARGALRRVIT